MSIRIARGLDLPDDAVTQTFALLARRGAGKTHTGSVLAEEMLDAGHQIVVLDPIGAWWGLRSKYPIAILGGEHADVPIDPRGGKTVAEFVVQEALSVIIDVSEFGANEMRRFVAEFGEAFYRKNRKPVHLFVEESDEFAPQKGINGPIAACLGAMQRIVRRGRQRGIGCTLITQRSAVINKDVLTQTEVLIAMQTTAPHDIAAIDGWIKHHGTRQEQRQILDSLPRLQRGEAWVYSPGWLQTLKRVKIRKRKTYDSSATPKPGESRKQPRSLADVDLGALTKQMQTAADEAKANDPKELKRQVRDLQKQIKILESRQPESKIECVEIPVLSEAEVAAISSVNERLGRVAGLYEEIASLWRKYGDSLPSCDAPNEGSNGRKATKSVPANKPNTGDSGLGRAETKILQAFFWLQGEEVTPAKVAFYAGYSASSGGFKNSLSKLRTAGLLAGWMITDDGIALASSYAEEKPTGPELREWLRPKLSKAENSLLDVLISSWPDRISGESLAGSSGYSASSGGFKNALSRLRSLQAAEGYERDGGVKAADVFLES